MKNRSPLHEIRKMSAIALVMIGIAGVVCWHAAYSIKSASHTQALAWSLSFAVVGIAAAVTVVAGSLQEEKFIPSLLGWGAVALGCGIVFAWMVAGIANYNSNGYLEHDTYNSGLIAGSVLGYMGGFIASMLSIVLFGGRDEWFEDQPDTEDKDASATPVRRIS